MKLTVSIEVKAHPRLRGSRDHVHVTGQGGADHSGATMSFPLGGRDLMTALREELAGERYASIGKELLTAAIAQLEAAQAGAFVRNRKLSGYTDAELLTLMRRCENAQLALSQAVEVVGGLGFARVRAAYNQVVADQLELDTELLARLADMTGSAKQ